MPIAYIPRTRERSRSYPPYRWVVTHEAPWTPLGKPIRECRVGLVSSGDMQSDFAERALGRARGPSDR